MRYILFVVYKFSFTFVHVFQIVGLETEKDYKYDGEDEKCHFEKSKVKATIKGGISIPKVKQLFHCL